MTEYRFQDAVEEIVRSTLFCAQEASDDWVPLLFLAFLCRHQATLDALSQAGFDVERFEQANQAWLSKAEDVCRKVESCEAMTLADLPEFDAIEDAGVVSWLANAGIHVMSAGRRDRVVDVYDILIAIKTVMSAGSVISQAWDQAGVTLAELRRRDAVLHGPQGFYTLTPPATTGFMADFLDDFLFGGPDEEARNEEVEEGEEGEGAATAGTESWGEVVADGRGGKVVRINLHDGDEVPEALKKMILRLADRVAGSDSGDEPENQAEAVETDKPRAKGLSREEKYLQGCTRDLSAAAAGGELDPLIGRDAEVLRICEILCCRRKNKPLILGETGAGKTALVEGLALRIHEGRVPAALRGLRIFALNASSMSSRYKGAFAEKLSEIVSVIKKVPGAVLFIDNLHMLINGTDGNSQEEYNALGHLAGDDSLRLITTSTFRAWRQTFSKDDLLTRRLQTVELAPVSRDEALRIVTGVLPKFEQYHGVHYAPEVAERAVALADRWITDRSFPDKALDLVDELGGAARMNREAGNETPIDVGVQKLPELVARMARIPAEQISESEHGELAALDKVIRSAVFGQDEAIDRIVSAIRVSRSGLGNPERPVGSFLFTGPTGVGKTEVARRLAGALGVQLLRFDMSEYAESHTISRLIGSPPGYVGHGEGGLLTEQVTKHPYSVVLLDEMEKAHPSLFNLMLQVMDHGKLTDASGREADFRNVVLIMTSNVGAREMERNTIGFGGSRTGDAGAAIRMAFTPEFRNRLDAVVRFAPLSVDSIASVVDKFLAELSDQLRARGVEPVYSADFRAWLARNGYDPHMGARPMRRLIADKVRRPLAEELLFGRLAGGGKVVFDIRTDAGGEEVVFEIPAADYNDQKPSRLSEDGPKGEA